MRFLSLSLTNYIGIYNGMGLNHIMIDFTLCRNSTVIIKGDNGSGKSTIMRALDIFPDSNDSFIPGLVAKKAIVIQDGLIVYEIHFVHGIKNNGERETTKAYIAKIDSNGMSVELNPNGNVNSYKDIVENELGLDPNYSALSNLGINDRGLADKKPAERKRFVNSIISSLDVYNNMYKIFTKQASVYRNLIVSISAKLGQIGDPNTLKSNLEAVTQSINTLNDQKDQSVEKLAQAKSSIDILDPGGVLQSRSTELMENYNLWVRRTEIAKTSLDNYMMGIHDQETLDNLENIMLATRDRRTRVESHIESLRSELDRLLHSRQEESDYLLAKSNRLMSISSNNYEIIEQNYIVACESMKQIAEEISSIGIPLGSITKSEYIIALETLKDISNAINQFRDQVDYNTMYTVIQDYFEGRVNPDIGYQFVSNESRIHDLMSEGANVDSNINVLKENIDKYKVLMSNRPKNCKINTCPFIEEAIKFMSENPDKTLADYIKSSKDIYATIDEYKQNEEENKNKQTAIRFIGQIIRYIEKNGEVLRKIGIFDEPRDLLDGILSGKEFSYMEQIYTHIDMANQIDEYNHLADYTAKLKSELDILSSKKELIDSLSSEIEALRIKLDGIQDHILNINRQIAISNQELSEIIQSITYYEELSQLYNNYIMCNTQMEDFKNQLDEISSKTIKINECLAIINAMKQRIIELTNQIAPFMSQRDQLIHKIQLSDDYNRELAEYNTQYNLLDKLKYYSSPTTGIQLPFMELYMGNILHQANELVSFLFQGRYQIQPFIINESEFRIPCLGNGYLNDDISSMSGGEIAMISMIISFSLLNSASTKYNILRLDEIDGTLDETNRIMFLDVLHKIMRIMGTEQCIMISHNTEISMENVDIIQLRTSIGESDYTNGNIIWKFQ